MIKHKRTQVGQSMTEYVIIVALLAVAGMAIYGLFGDTVRGRLGNTTEEGGSFGRGDVGAPRSAVPASSRDVTKFSDDPRE